MKIYVITLSNSIERQNLIKEKLDSYNISFEFFYGIDGRLLTTEQINLFYDHKKATKIYKKLHNTEIACSLSHKLIYEKIIKENVEKAIVLEDAISILPDFSQIIQFLLNGNFYNTIIKLDRLNSKQTNNNNSRLGYLTPWHRIKINKKYYIGQPLKTPFLTGAYFIDKKAAYNMYSMTKQIFLPADAWWFFRNKIKLRTINTAVIWRNWSNIQSINQSNNFIENNKKNIIFTLAKYFNKIKNYYNYSINFFYYILK